MREIYGLEEGGGDGRRKVEGMEGGRWRGWKEVGGGDGRR